MRGRIKLGEAVWGGEVSEDNVQQGREKFGIGGEAKKDEMTGDCVSRWVGRVG